MAKKKTKKPLKKKPVKKPKPKKRPAKKKGSAKKAAAFAPTGGTVGAHPPITCYLVVDKWHPYYPVYWNAIDGCYRCPRCGGTPT